MSFAYNSQPACSGQNVQTFCESNSAKETVWLGISDEIAIWNLVQLSEANEQSGGDGIVFFFSLILSFLKFCSATLLTITGITGLKK